MASAEYNIESIVIAILEDSATFAVGDVVHHVEDDSTVSKGNRLTVKVDPMTPKVTSHRPDKKAPVWQSTITISAQHGGSETDFDTWRDAIDDAMMPTTYAASVVTLATTHFPNGIVIEPASGGTIFDAPSNRRTLTRTFPVVFRL